MDRRRKNKDRRKVARVCSSILQFSGHRRSIKDREKSHHNTGRKNRNMWKGRGYRVGYT
jgi:hypothetical protein